MKYTPPFYINYSSLLKIMQKATYTIGKKYLKIMFLKTFNFIGNITFSPLII